MRGLRYLALVLLPLATVAQAQVMWREATPAKQAARTVTAADGTQVSLPVMAPVDAAGTVVIPGLDYETAQVFSGFGYTVSTAVVAVSAGNYLMAELSNPAGSGVNYVLTSRVLSSNVVNGGAPLEYLRYASASTLSATPTPTGVTIGNRIANGAAISGTFRYQMGSALPTGTVTSSGFIPTGGEEKRIKDIVIVPPGGKLIYAVGGAGGGLAAATRIAVTFLFYTRPV